MKNRWFIKITEENKDILKSYWQTIVSPRVFEQYEFYGTLLSWDYDRTYLHYGRDYTGKGDRAIEITLEEFQRDVLGPSINPSYEIY